MGIICEVSTGGFGLTRQRSMGARMRARRPAATSHRNHASQGECCHNLRDRHSPRSGAPSRRWPEVRLVRYGVDC